MIQFKESYKTIIIIRNHLFILEFYVNYKNNN